MAFGALVMSLFPLNYFFQFLFYTDVGSTLFILLAYYQQLKSNHKLSALCGLIAIAFRQTNIVWLGFCMFQFILCNADTLVKTQEPKMSIKQNAETGTINVTQNRNKKRSNTLELLVRTPNEAFGHEFDLSKYLIKLYREDFWGKKLIYPDLLRVFDPNLIKPYVLVFYAFVAFLYFNNGIVVGDRANHQVSFHLCQLFYFAAFSALFSFATFVFSYKKLKNLLTFFTLNFKAILMVVLPIFCIIVKNFTYEHMFLLSDNRHYTFYVWSRLIRRFELARYLLTPVYLACVYLIYRNLTQSGKSVGWMLAYAVCVFIGVVPQQLIEFRYFIIPYYMYRFNLTLSSWKELLAELFFNCLVNSLTIYIFLNKTFQWQDAPEEIQRFMW